MHGDTGHGTVFVRFFIGYGFTYDHPVVLDSFQILVPVGFIQSVAGPVSYFSPLTGYDGPLRVTDQAKTLALQRADRRMKIERDFISMISLLFYKVTDCQMFFTFSQHGGFCRGKTVVIPNFLKLKTRCIP